MFGFPTVQVAYPDDKLIEGQYNAQAFRIFIVLTRKAIILVGFLGASRLIIQSIFLRWRRILKSEQMVPVFPPPKETNKYLHTIRYAPRDRESNFSQAR